VQVEVGGGLVAEQHCRVVGEGAGYGDALLNRLENVPPERDMTNVFRSPNRQAMMGEMATEPDLWLRRLDRERTMAQTTRAALGGSMTADNLADQADALGPRILADMATAPGQTAFNQAIRVLGNFAQGADEQTRQMIARALLSSDPAAALAPHVVAMADGEGLRAHARSARLRAR
jgi:hypothetical protein